MTRMMIERRLLIRAKARGQWSFRVESRVSNEDFKFQLEMVEETGLEVPKVLNLKVPG